MAETLDDIDPSLIFFIFLLATLLCFYLLLKPALITAEEAKNLKRKVQYDKRIKGEIKNVCRECGNVWFYDQAKLNSLTEKLIDLNHATNVSAPMAMGSNWAHGRGNTVINQSVLQSAQLAGMSAQTTEAQIEALRQCPDCNSNNVKRTRALKRRGAQSPQKSRQNPSFKSNDSISIEAKLEKAKNLYDKKLIDESDYEQIKTKILKNIDFDESLDAEMVDETPNTQLFYCQDCNFKAVLGDGSTHCPNCKRPYPGYEFRYGHS